MQNRFFCLVGMLAIFSCGCHSYYPYGYSGTGPYAGPPPGYFAPPGASAHTGAPPQTYSQSLPPNYIPPNQQPSSDVYGVPPGGFSRGRPVRSGTIVSSPNRRNGVTAQPTGVTTTPVEENERPVPNPEEARTLPDALGSEDADRINVNGRSDTNPDRPRGNGIPSEAEEAAEELGFDDGIRSPTSAIRRAGGVAGPPRNGRRSPYRRSADYGFISGTIAQDPESDDWIVTYDPEGNDEYNGQLTIKNHPDLARFRDGDMISLRGKLDRRNRDRIGRPLYNPQNGGVKRLVERDESF